MSPTEKQPDSKGPHPRPQPGERGFLESMGLEPDGSIPEGFLGEEKPVTDTVTAQRQAARADIAVVKEQAVELLPNYPGDLAIIFGVTRKCLTSAIDLCRKPQNTLSPSAGDARGFQAALIWLEQYCQATQNLLEGPLAVELAGLVPSDDRSIAGKPSASAHEAALKWSYGVLRHFYQVIESLTNIGPGTDALLDEAGHTEIFAVVALSPAVQTSDVPRIRTTLLVELRLATDRAKVNRGDSPAADPVETDGIPWDKLTAQDQYVSSGEIAKAAAATLDSKAIMTLRKFLRRKGRAWKEVGLAIDLKGKNRRMWHFNGRKPKVRQVINREVSKLSTPKPRDPN